MSCPSKAPLRIAAWLAAPLCVFLLLVLLLPSVTFCVTPEPPARPPNYVVDLADIVSPATEDQLNKFLQELDQKTSAQMMVLTILSLDGEDIAGFALSMAEKWKPGQKGKDNGVLLVVALKDKKYRIEVGYGLESILPDSLVGSIGRDYLVPYFRKNDYGAGIFSAVTEIIRIIGTQQGVELSGVSQPERPQKTKKSSMRPVHYFLTFLIVSFTLGMFYLAWRTLRSSPQSGPTSSARSSPSTGSSYWSGGGGFSGSSSGYDSGGFGGGGGGDFGGGGASGDW